MTGYDSKYTGLIAAQSAKGLLTGTATRVLGDTTMLVKSLYYDCHGNVTSIIRGGINSGGVAFDRLSFTYAGNQIQSVTDSAALDLYLGEVAQVVSGSYPDAIDYDLDGRITRDDSRGITQIDYNPLGLPSWIRLDANHDIHMTYHSDGTKHEELMREFYIATVMRINRITGDTTWVDQRKVRSVCREFIGNMVKETGKPPRIYNEVGYIDIYNGGDSIVYYFYEKDHLGSVRAVVDDDGNQRLSVKYFASGIPETDYSAFVDNRLHTGKQWMAFGGLSWYDNLARMYDPIFMRFTTPDPLQEKYPHLSPYSYCANNPVRIVDLKGNDIYYFDQSGNYTHKDIKDGDNRICVITKEKVNDQILTHQNFYELADPINDGKMIDKGLITHLEFVSEEDIKNALKEQGAFESGDINFIKESAGGGKFDYTISFLIPKFGKKEAITMLFLPENDYMAHNLYNFGNYLWGATGYTVGLNYGVLQMGAHLNSLLSPRRNNYSIQLDSKDDQRSIIKGIYHAIEYNYRKFKK